MRTLISLLAASSLVLSSALLAVEHPKTKAEYDKIVQQAKDDGKHIAVKHSTTWCHFCKDIKDLFDDLEVKVKNFVFIELDGDNKEFASVRKEHKATGYPTTVIIDTKKDQNHTVMGAAKSGITNKVMAVSQGMPVTPAGAVSEAKPAPTKAPAKQQPAKKGKKSSRKAVVAQPMPS